MQNVKWKISPAPVGRYKSFEHRRWPTAFIGEKVIAHITCQDNYSLGLVKSGNHAPLNVRIAKWNLTEEEKKKFGTFIWLKFKKTASTLNEAEQMVNDFLTANPHYLD